MQTNHWALKDSEIQALLAEYSLDLKGEYNRKEAIPAIVEFENKIASGEIVMEGKKGDYLKSLAKKEPGLRVTRVIFHNITENGKPYVFVGHNGKAYYIPKEQEVDVPDYILNSCIKDAVEERLYPETQMNGDIKWKKRRLQRYPYSIVLPSFEIGKKEEE